MKKAYEHKWPSKTVEVIADISKPGQDPITEMIGKQFPVHEYFLDTEAVQINAAPFEGFIILNKGEYRFI